MKFIKLKILISLIFLNLNLIYTDINILKNVDPFLEKIEMIDKASLDNNTIGWEDEVEDKNVNEINNKNEKPNNLTQTNLTNLINNLTNSTNNLTISTNSTKPDKKRCDLQKILKES